MRPNIQIIKCIVLVFLVVMHFVHGQFHVLILQVPETIGTSLFFSRAYGYWVLYHLCAIKPKPLNKCSRAGAGCDRGNRYKISLDI